MPFITEVESIYIQRMYTGWITLRNQLATPIKLMGRRVIELYDALIAGNDWEVTPYLSLKRRAGHTLLVGINYAAMYLYSWKSNTMGTIPIFDTTGDVEYYNGSATISLLTKTSATQSSILGIGNYLYLGNGSFNLKWDGPTGSQQITNWGISAASAGAASSTVGPDLAGTGAQSGAAAPWTNPTNVTSTSSFATVTLPGVTNSVTSVVVNNHGSNYSQPTTVTFTGGGGSGATAQAFVAKGSGQISGISVTSGGSGYNSAPAVGISGGAGTGATATAYIGAGRNTTNNAEALQATNFSFSVPTSSTITAITATFQAEATVTSSGGGTGTVTCAVQLLSNGAPVGTPKNVTLTLDGALHTYTVGGTDLWGTTLTPTQLNSSTFGFQISLSVAYTGTWSVAFELNSCYTSASVIALSNPAPTGSGTFTAVNGYSYADAYGNSVSGEISNATFIGNNTGPFTNQAYVGVPLIASSDPQVNQIHCYRTTDSGGGNQYFEIQTSPYPNVGYTLTAAANASGGSTVYTGVFIPNISNLASAVGQYFLVTGFVNAGNNGTFPCAAATQTSITLTNSGGVAETHAAAATLLAEDTTPDTSLQVTSQAEINLGNTPPPAGLVNLEWFAGRMWGAINNVLYASTGPETISGTAPNSNWNPLFQWVLPGGQIIRNIAGPNGMLSFVGDDCYIVRGTDITNYTVNVFVKNFGIRTYNAVDTDGTNLYVFTSDRQFIQVSPSGANDIGLPIADQLLNVDPTQCYVTVNRYGLDSIVRILDTVNNVYYDFNLNQQCWNLPGILQMPSCTAMGSIEVTPGVWRLLLSSNSSGTNSLAYRDITNFLDLGAGYTPNAVFGSIQLADPGGLAKFGALGGFVMEYTNAGTAPTLSVLMNDVGANLGNSVGSQITGNFTSLNAGKNPFNWPPTLGAQPINYRSLGYYLMYGKSTAGSLSGFVRHLQFQISAVSQNAATELIGFGIFGDLKQEAAAPGQIPQLQGR
jgi:hypothetical protein